MRLYLIRHGESITNRTGQFAGQTDVPLTELGEKQAICVTAFFENVELDAVYSSDLSRAMNTVCGAAQAHGLSVCPDEGLREVYAGQWEGCHFTELPILYPEDYAVWRNDIGNSRCTGGESMVEAVTRADAALRRIAERHLHDTIAVASHGGIIRGLLTLWQNGDISHMREMTWAPNASVTVAEYKDGAFTVEQIGLTEHLGALTTELPKTV